MEYQNNLKNEFKQIRPLGPDAAHDRTAPLDQALWRPAKPAHPGTESGLTRPSRLTGSKRRARPHRADAHGARGMAGLPRGRRWPRCTGKTTSSTSTSSRTRRAPTRRREAREATGHRERLWAHRRRGGGGVRHTTASLASGPADKRLERWDVAASGGDWKMAQGARLSPVKGVGAGRAKARWWLRAPSSVLA
jgi:hypothetical protein